MKTIMDKIGGRKMFLTMILFTISTICLFTNCSSFSEWGEFTKWLFGIFAVGNIGEHCSNQFGKKNSN